ncbi:MAG TPA: ATP-binding protein [Acidobacteriota bacterium]|nr:ATP-binding protein [Acidobacteriota bacterium]
MEIRTIMESLGAQILAGEEQLNAEIEHVYASDLMSDVLAFGKPNSILLTGLATQQAVISSHMAEFKGVVFVRGKRPKDSSERFAKEHQLVLLATPLDMFEACLRVKSPHGESTAHPAAADKESRSVGILLCKEFSVEGGDFSKGGLVSTEVKSLLKTIGFDSRVVRRVAICTYEGEMNVIMHALRARIRLAVTPSVIEVVIDDEGKGIPDVDLAMQQGFTTATEEMRAMGFGSGMGLPNIKNNTDDLKITSDVGKGTTLSMKFLTDRWEK